MLNLINIYSLTLDELTNQALALGLKKHNAKQIFQWIYQKQITNFKEITNIAKSAIPILQQYFSINQWSIKQINIDPLDQTTKFLFELDDHEKIETVLMKFNYGYSLCISSQVGCNMGCKFCASGLLKKVRDLSATEMVMQYVMVSKYLFTKYQQKISNLVIMGIGEPFDNFNNLVKAISIFNQPFGINLGMRHMTVSTCGLAKRILDFAKIYPQVNLAISLHAPNDSLRSKLMPINKAFGLKELINTVKKYIKLTNRRISFEYILLNQINDQDVHAQELAKLLSGLLCYVNLIIYNKVRECQFVPSNRINMFSTKLTQLKIANTKRLERGASILAACGQLRAHHEKK